MTSVSSVTAKVVHKYEFVNCSKTPFGPPLVGDEQPLPTLLDLARNAHAAGIRSFKEVVSQVVLDDGQITTLQSEPLEGTDTYLFIGQLVDESYLRSLLQAEEEVLALRTLLYYIICLRAGERIVKLAYTDQFARVNSTNNERVISPTGEPVVYTLTAPAGWCEQTEFEGSNQILYVVGELCKIRRNRVVEELPPGTGKLILAIDEPPSGLLSRIRQAIDLNPHVSIYSVHSGEILFDSASYGTLVELTFDIDNNRRLYIGWNGEKFAIRLTEQNQSK